MIASEMFFKGFLSVDCELYWGFQLKIHLNLEKSSDALLPRQGSVTGSFCRCAGGRMFDKPCYQVAAVKLYASFLA